MRVPKYRVITDDDEDSFGNTEDFETALSLAREAARNRAGRQGRKAAAVARPLIGIAKSARQSAIPTTPLLVERRDNYGGDGQGDSCKI